MLGSLIDLLRPRTLWPRVPKFSARVRRSRSCMLLRASSRDDARIELGVSTLDGGGGKFPPCKALKIQKTWKLLPLIRGKTPRPYAIPDTGAALTRSRACSSIDRLSVSVRIWVSAPAGRGGKFSSLQSFEKSQNTKILARHPRRDPRPTQPPAPAPPRRGRTCFPRSTGPRFRLRPLPWRRAPRGSSG